MNEKEIKKITSLSLAKYRRKYRLFLVEGVHLVNELFKSGWKVESLILTDVTAIQDDFREIIKVAANRGIAIHRVDERLFKKLSSTETPQGVMAVAYMPSMSLENILAKNRIIIADGISNPGNLGTIIRTAVAFGFDGLIATAGSADIYSPKVVRATQGAIFSIIFTEHLAPAEVMENLGLNHDLYILSSHDGQDIGNIKPSNNIALVVGAEIAGVNEEFMEANHQQIHIPMPGDMESLNAAVAAGIAMFELSRLKKR